MLNSGDGFNTSRHFLLPNTKVFLFHRHSRVYCNNFCRFFCWLFQLSFKNKQTVFFKCPVTDSTSPAASMGAPWVCEQDGLPPSASISVPSISLTESPSPASPQPEAGDSGDGEYDDGPEYLAIGNLGRRSRRDSRSSTHSSDQCEADDQPPHRNSLMLPPPRRSSYSEGQKGPGRGSRGHTRSFSDTGINQKLRNGK